MKTKLMLFYSYCQNRQIGSDTSNRRSGKIRCQYYHCLLLSLFSKQYIVTTLKVGLAFIPSDHFPKVCTDTIERNILDLAARKRLSLYTKENSSGSLNLSSFSKDSETAIDNPEKRKTLQRGDFIHKVDDMLAILFPHMFEEIEYLVPPTDITDRDVEMIESDVPRCVQRCVQTGIEINAIAGPSRAQ
jgi:hypothetical protein